MSRLLKTTTPLAHNEPTVAAFPVAYLYLSLARLSCGLRWHGVCAIPKQPGIRTLFRIGYSIPGDRHIPGSHCQNKRLSRQWPCRWPDQTYLAPHLPTVAVNPNGLSLPGAYCSLKVAVVLATNLLVPVKETYSPADSQTVEALP
jgi:hypothetical protein